MTDLKWEKYRKAQRFLPNPVFSLTSGSCIMFPSKQKLLLIHTYHVMPQWTIKIRMCMKKK